MSDAYINTVKSVFAESTLWRELQFEIREVNDEHVQTQMGPTSFSTFRGSYIGPALVAFAEHTAGLLAAYTPDPNINPQSTKASVVCTQMNINFIASAQEGAILGEATWLRRGRRQSLLTTQLHDQTGRLLLHMVSTHVPAIA